MDTWTPLDEALSKALYDPLMGYYAQELPLGKQGDFITAPELSQLFGEMIGLWCLEQWQNAGSPTPVRLIELGPGRGLMMADILRVFKLIPSLYETTTCHLIEVSPILKALQRERLASHLEKISWHDQLEPEDLPTGFTLLIANEFFDALPISQHLKTNDGWMIRGIKSENGTPSFEDRPCPPPPLRFDATNDIPIEICPLDGFFTKQISHCLKESGGAALIIDYGDDLRVWQGDTLQALKNHQRQNILESFGKADISHHVDFYGLRQLFSEQGINCPPVETQGDFLRNLGIELRANQLAQTMHAHQRGKHFGAVHRLIGSNEMGILFKVLKIPYLHPPANAI